MKIFDKLRDYVPAIAFLFLILIVWQLSVVIFKPPEFLLPAPSQIIANLLSIGAAFLPDFWVTTTEILEGFALGSIVGVVLAIIMAQSKLLYNMLYPVVLAVQVVPKTALAPLFIVWFGFGILSKVLVAALIAFFPLIVSTGLGLVSVDRDLMDLARTYNPSRLRILVKIKLPHSLPFIFNGLKTASTLAVVGAVVAEFIEAEAGLGRLILVAENDFNTPLLFSSMALLTLIGIILFAAIEIAERLVAPWYFKMREHT